MNPIRRHLTAIGVVWLSFQAGVLALSPLASCCAAATHDSAADDDECCQGLAPGQICPLHKHRHHQTPSTDTHHDGTQQDRTHQQGTQNDCAIRGDCGSMDPALLSLGFGLGVVEPPASLAVAAVSHPVPQFTACVFDCARSLDPPPPRA